MEKLTYLPKLTPRTLNFLKEKTFPKIHSNPSVLCTPPFEKTPIGFVYSPLWKSTPSVLCSPPFEKALFRVGAYFGVDVYFGKYGSSRRQNYRALKGAVLLKGTGYFRWSHASRCNLQVGACPLLRVVPVREVFHPCGRKMSSSGERRAFLVWCLGRDRPVRRPFSGSGSWSGRRRNEWR